MLNITNELKAKLLAAQNAEEVAELVKADGREITAEDAAKLWNEITKCRDQEGKALSPNELEAVSGGVDRDWLTDGCAATVEPGSDCWGTDYCVWLPVTYEHKPVDSICPVCGTYLYLAEVNYGRTFSGETYRYRCKTCGYEKKVYEN